MHVLKLLWKDFLSNNVCLFLCGFVSEVPSEVRMGHQMPWSWSERWL